MSALSEPRRGETIQPPTPSHGGDALQNPLWSAVSERLVEARHLYLKHLRAANHGADAVIRKCAEIETAIELYTGVAPRMGRVLDLGAGPQLKHAKYFAHFGAEAHAVEETTLEEEGGVRAYWRLFRRSGVLRVGKTLARRSLGIDRRFDDALARRLNKASGSVQCWRMAPDALDFADESFDFIYSTGLLSRLRDPEAAVAEARRVLRPGGTLFLGAHPYSSDGGCLDPRIFSDRRDEVPFWAHLRPDLAHLVRPNAYLNRWPLASFEEMFAQAFPNATLVRFRRQEGRLRPKLAALRAEGALAAYSDDELLCDEVAAVWRKPS